MVGCAYWSGLLARLREMVQEEDDIFGAELDLCTVVDGP